VFAGILIHPVLHGFLRAEQQQYYIDILRGFLRTEQQHIILINCVVSLRTEQQYISLYQLIYCVHGFLRTEQQYISLYIDILRGFLRTAEQQQYYQGAIKHGRGNALINDRATCDAH
jgi:pyridoxal/pyridoxine/pyridoxamine kinase